MSVNLNSEKFALLSWQKERGLTSALKDTNFSAFLYDLRLDSKRLIVGCAKDPPSEDLKMMISKLSKSLGIDSSYAIFSEDSRIPFRFFLSAMPFLEDLVLLGPVAIKVAQDSGIDSISKIRLIQGPKLNDIFDDLNVKRVFWEHLKSSLKIQ
jgi:hypothetical protein